MHMRFVSGGPGLCHSWHGRMLYTTEEAAKGTSSSQRLNPDLLSDVVTELYKWGQAFILQPFFRGVNLLCGQSVLVVGEKHIWHHINRGISLLLYKEPLLHVPACIAHHVYPALTSPMHEWTCLPDCWFKLFIISTYRRQTFLLQCANTIYLSDKTQQMNIEYFVQLKGRLKHCASAVWSGWQC